MPKPVKTALPPKLDLGGGWRVEWAAVDPVTGDPVPGVIVSDTSLQVAGDFGQGGDSGAPVGPFMLVPGPAA